MESHQIRQIMNMLADQNRWNIYQLLKEKGEMNVLAIQSGCGMYQATVSHHLGLMKRAGIVVSRRDGKWVFYKVHKDIAYDFIIRTYEACHPEPPSGGITHRAVEAEAV